ncbi:MAG: tryptophan/tyrosine permease [Pseudodesulfovibrio sp.]|uniref:Tryptophan/tyrosine permease n=1 Tax=Pseudodesulfovibrio aespoeensis (strain ATCC 700646 / DSM 10631 / Aspo-2) TaxID=643562 RepID=E6VT26_PSEA9|nr:MULTISPECIES: aromatic amino acid transport family protein [Pseudodesulfovibrio]MBU4474719.1 tryptophan/tyrosine permease [Pseudomonadota bacterium]ADU62076.1 Tryptophan/tyrosine permease [Pseudodesulfovibrio aespoeensis Aspo-2]MBU4515954.1 tryptophan/tyrosine permease [Pseudomonadota bacterium]MBU4522844.1 tryptophan/tyrosine permease [Pseudomonadota bacterium]MBU4559968.1 tryptophan/tyrosine permease [Pseudomonadota bacterium]
MAQSSPSTGKVITTSLIVTGNMLGAGILALPVDLGPAGLFPAVLGALGVWALMTCTGLIIARQPFLAQNRDADLPTFFEVVLGPVGKWVSVAANLVIFYGLLTAYLAGVASVLVESLGLAVPSWVALAGYFCIATLFASFGDVVLRKGATVFMTIMWGLFAVLVVMVVPHFEGHGARGVDLVFFTSALPILVVAFNFHNVIPTLCRVLDHDRQAITRAIWFGSGLGLTMTLIWTVAAMLTLPMESANGVDIISAFKLNEPATVPLSRLITSRLFLDVSVAFAVVAMTTAYMATGVAMLSFLRDVGGRMGRNRLVVWLTAFVPPLLVGALYPNIFIDALNVVGGIGVGSLFGILPGLLLIRQGEPGSRRRLAGWGIVCFFSVVLLVEIAQMTGLVHITPDVEYWNARQGR